nr:hypothetical protein A132_18735 [Vibrio kanaloae 5S-149]
MKMDYWVGAFRTRRLSSHSIDRTHTRLALFYQTQIDIKLSLIDNFLLIIICFDLNIPLVNSTGI